MIKKGLITFIILFVAFNVFLKFNQTNWDSGQYQYQTNIIKAERYLYSNKPIDSVFIGSSLSARLISDSLPGIYNMAMSGMSLYDGYSIIKKRNQFPRCLFIEVNIIFRPESNEFTKSFESDIGIFLKRNVPALRAGNQPLGILQHYIKKLKRKKDDASTESEVPENLFKEILDNQKDFYSHPDTAVLNAGLNKLKKIVNEANKQGSQISFYEMPINSSLENLRLSVLIRKSILESFPQIKYIPIPDKIFKTTDGVHLTKKESAFYSKYLKAKIDNL